MNAGPTTAARQRIAEVGDRYQRRLEIEGLRALAVLAVVFFHVGFPLAGGYVGVDVFFVISGFLITMNIVKDHEAGIFTFGRFYMRRIRRLFPALAVTLLATLGAGFMFFAPDDMARLAQTALFSVASLSNVLFWRETGYFDPAATLKPLLHTWSLSVEEQFYLIWPAVVVCALRLLRSRALMSTVIAIGVCSLVSAELLRAAYPAAVFYLMPFRMFELCAGAMLAVIPHRRPTQFWAQFAMLAGLAAIGYSVVVFDSATTLRHFWPLLPCAGAALIIYAGNTPWSGWLLSNRAATFVGAISYSLYLVHWPVVVFYKYVRGTEVAPKHQVIVVLVCVAAAATMYRLVELPFRSGRSDRGPVRTRTALPALAATAVCVVAIGAHAWYTNGWAFRLPPELRDIPSETAMWEERNPVARVGSCFLYEQSRPDLDQARCLALDSTRPNYLIVGDSFAADAYVYLSAAYPQVNFLQATAGNCHPLIEHGTDETCKTLLHLVFAEFIPATKLDGVVLAASWQLSDLDPLEETIDRLRALAPRVMLVGAGIRFQASVPALIFKSRRITKAGVEDFVDSHISPFEYTLNRIMGQRFSSKTDAFIDVQSLMCERGCGLFTPKGEMIYVDFGHLTLAGSRYLAPRLAARYSGVFDASAKGGSRYRDAGEQAPDPVPLPTAGDTRVSYTASACNLESINREPFGVERVTAAKASPLTITGWAYDEVGKRSARLLHVVLIDATSQTRYSWSVTQPMPRPDVAQYLRLPDLVETGFEATLSLSSVDTGTYRMVVGIERLTDTAICDVGRSISVQ